MSPIRRESQNHSDVRLRPSKDSASVHLPHRLYRMIFRPYALSSHHPVRLGLIYSCLDSRGNLRGCRVILLIPSPY